LLRDLRSTPVIWLLAALALGCEGRPETRPEDAVHAFFVAAEANDCAAASKWLDGPAKERFENEECDAALGALRKKGFERVLGSQVDGRDPELHLVRVRFSDERMPAVIGVRSTGKGHRIVTF